MYDFGLLVKSMRVEKHLSQAQLGKKLGVSDAIISQYESNQKFPSMNTLIEMANFFNVSLDYLVGIDKKEAVVIADLSDSQKVIIKKLLNELRTKPIVKKPGLSVTQQEIINDLIVEFSSK